MMIMRRGSAYRFKFPVHYCTWQNRLYALTICGLFFLFSLELSGLLKFQFAGVQNRSKQSNLALRPRNKLPAAVPNSVISFRRIINHHNFRYVTNPEDYCERNKPIFLIFVTSSPKNFERRSAIRQTWGNQKQLANAKTGVLFLIGNPQNLELQEQLQEEFKFYGDIIQEDFADSYKNLTLKSVMALKWAVSYCFSLRAIMKTDDDIFVNIPYLLEHLKQNKFQEQRWIMGCIKNHALQPVHIVNGKPMFESPVIAPPGHPPFVAGAGYVISGDIIRELYEASLRSRIIPVEDVFITAHCGRAIGVKPEHDSRFTCGDRVDNDCSMKFRFTGHKITPTRQHEIWKKLHYGDCGV